VSVTSLGAGATAVASSDDLAAVDAWWRAIEYLGVVQTHLAANPLLRRALEPGQDPRLRRIAEE
jgi:phosphoketolase